MLIVLAVIGMDTYPTRFCIHRQFSVWLDTNAAIAMFYRKGKPAVTFAWDTETYTLIRWNMTGAQTRLPPGQSPY